MGTILAPMLQSRAVAASANERVRIAVIGLSRGAAHVTSLTQIPNVEIVYLSDLDEKRMAKPAQMVQDKSGKAPKLEKDFRKILADKNVDAISIATPNHWQAPMTILACEAGKHVYVEKPGSHNAHEALLMVEAARKHKRVVQMGNQRRSFEKVREAMQRLHEGVIGKVTVGRSYYFAKRGAVKPKTESLGLDLDLWQGPAPLRKDVENYLHYDWHWDWHWGGGELANNGPHALDVVRWGLKVDYPTMITSVGARYQYEDLQKTPDTNFVSFDFGGKCGAVWDGSSCFPRRQDKLPMVEFYGEKGSLSIALNDSYTIYDPNGEVLDTQKGKGGDVPHFQNFIDGIRNGTPLNSDIEEGQKSVMLCHLGNIAYRSQSTVLFDPEKKQLKPGQDAAQKFWSRTYREGYEPKV